MIKSCMVVEVIKVEFLRGEGKDKSDPVREVTQFYTISGELLAEHDPVRDRKA